MTFIVLILTSLAPQYSPGIEPGFIVWECTHTETINKAQVSVGSAYQVGLFLTSLS